MAIFPAVAGRRREFARRLRGGERQMCAIGRAMTIPPAPLMLTQPSVWLSPPMAGRVFRTGRSRARRGRIAVPIAKQNVARALAVAARGHVLHEGRADRQGDAAALREGRRIGQTRMGL